MSVRDVSAESERAAALLLCGDDKMPVRIRRSGSPVLESPGEVGRLGKKEDARR